MKVRDVKPKYEIEVIMPPEGQRRKSTINNPEGEEHIHKPRVGDIQGVQLTTRQPTAKEAEEFTGKLRENWEHQRPNPDQVLDDTQRGDRDPRDRGVIVTRVRSIDDYKIERRNPYGHWYILGLPETIDLGSFTGLKLAQDALLGYLKRQQKGR